jgi:hypothetical protein
MPPVLFLALIGAAGIAGYKIWSGLMDQAHTQGRKDRGQMRRATAPVRDLGNLEWDEGSGVYRPRAKRES